MRQYNLVGRGERESKAAYVERLTDRLAGHVEGPVLERSFATLEVRVGGVYLLDETGMAVAVLPAIVNIPDKDQNFGGLGNPVVRIDVHPMTREKAEQIAGAIQQSVREYIAFMLTAAELEALAWLAANP